jgi:hypothetical protein
MTPTPLLVTVPPEPPATLVVRPGGIPRELTDRPQWLCWRWSRPRERWSKVPVRSDTLRPASSTDPSTWGAFSEALNRYLTDRVDGVGYALDGPPYCGFDLDDCFKGGELLPWAVEIVNALDSYTERSVRGGGLRIICEAPLPAYGDGVLVRKKRNRPEGGCVEAYDRGRFLTITGHALEGHDAIRACPEAVAEVHRAHVQEPPWLTREERPRPAAPAPPPLSRSDEEVLAAARHSEVAPEFEALWRGDASAYRKSDGSPDPSAADLALCNYLRFFAGPDAGQIDRLFRHSGLMRPKWERQTYRDLTINTALATAEHADPRHGQPRVVIGPSPGVNGARPPSDPPPPELVTLPDLLALQFPPQRWAVPGIVTEGFTLLAGKPKLGKSWLALNLAITVAGGGTALGNVRVEPGDVLYLALEDRLRRLKGRALKLLPAAGCDPSPRLSFATEWPRSHQGGLDGIKRWFDSVPEPRLVVIDVWARFRPPGRLRASAYDQDYEAAAPVKDQADAAGAAVVVVHHTRKASADDVFDEVNATTGLTGAADATLILARARNENEAVLHIAGRDIEEGTIALEFTPDTCTWHHRGDARERDNTRAQRLILDTLRRSPGSSFFAGEVAELLDLNPNTVRSALLRFYQAGEVRKVGSKYAWPAEESGGADDF